MKQLLSVWICVLACAAMAMAQASGAAAAVTAGANGRCLVLPFSNHSGDESLNWMGESFVVGFRQALRGSGITVLSRKDRDSARILLGAPAEVPLSHASMMRLAQDADARWLVMGSFDYDGEQLSATAAVVDMQKEHLVRLKGVNAPLRSLQDLEAKLGWSVRQQMDPAAAGNPEPAAEPVMPVSAYEDYVRARLAAKPDDQIKLLRVAEQLAPKDNRILLALGQAYFAAAMDAPAAAVLESIPAPAPEYEEAAFTAGLAEYGLGHYAKAITQWQTVEKTLPLPAVVHNLSVAQAAAQGKPQPGRLQLDFPVEEYIQLQRVVAGFADEKLASMPPPQQVAYELKVGEHLLEQHGWAAASDAFQKVIALAAPGQAEALGAAHAGLAAIWYARHDSARAEKEVAAALAADPNNAEARQLQQKLAEQGPGNRD